MELKKKKKQAMKHRLYCTTGVGQTLSQGGDAGIQYSMYIKLSQINAIWATHKYVFTHKIPDLRSNTVYRCFCTCVFASFQNHKKDEELHLQQRGIVPKSLFITQLQFCYETTGYVMTVLQSVICGVNSKCRPADYSLTIFFLCGIALFWI